MTIDVYKTFAPAWAPPEWYCSTFPLGRPEQEEVALEPLVRTLERMVDSITEADRTALGKALHVSHILKTLQGRDGRWPAVVNARTGEPIGEERTFAPAPLFERLNTLLDSTEFSFACEDAKAGGYVSSVEMCS